MIARFKSLAVLKQLDSKRSAQIVRCLQESNLIKVDHVSKAKPIVDLSWALLRGMNLPLDHQNFQSDFSNAYLAETDLTKASLQDLDISGSHFDYAYMNGAELTRTTSINAKCGFEYTSSRKYLADGCLLDRCYLLACRFR